jgi:hypothetical protein
MAAVTTLERIAGRVAHGGTVGEEDASVILASHDLIAIGMMADDVRRQIHGALTTFVRVFELHVDAVPSSLPAGVAAGEFRVIGQPHTVDAACKAVASARRLAGSAPLFGFSLVDLAGLAATSPDTYSRLKAAGLDGIAEVPADVPSGVAAVADARAAGLLLLRLTIHAPSPDPLALLQRVSEIQRSHGGFRTFAPLPRRAPAAAPTTGYDDVKLVALARVMCRDIPSIQVDWPLYGPKLAQVALTMGADDVDGIVAADPAVLGARRSAIEEIRGNIRAAGLQPVERDAMFEHAGDEGHG